MESFLFASIIKNWFLISKIHKIDLIMMSATTTPSQGVTLVYISVLQHFHSPTGKSGKGYYS